MCTVVPLPLCATPIAVNKYRGADKSSARPGRKQAHVSVRMTWISFGALPCRKKKNLMTARVSMLLKSRTPLTCFRAWFLPGRAKNLSAPRISYHRWKLCFDCQVCILLHLPCAFKHNGARLKTETRVCNASRTACLCSKGSLITWMYFVLRRL